MRIETKYKDIEIQVSTFEGFPVMETITAQDQKEFISNGYGSLKDLIDWHYSSYRDWQSDY